MYLALSISIFYFSTIKLFIPWELGALYQLGLLQCFLASCECFSKFFLVFPCSTLSGSLLLSFPFILSFFSYFLLQLWSQFYCTCSTLLHRPHASLPGQGRSQKPLWTRVGQQLNKLLVGTNKLNFYILLNFSFFWIEGGGHGHLYRPP